MSTEQKSPSELIVSRPENAEKDRPRSADFKSLYINNSVCGYSAWDIQVSFSRVQITMSDAPKLEEVAVVTMSPRHAKALVEALAANVKGYEAQYGEIAIIDNGKVQAE